MMLNILFSIILSLAGLLILFKRKFIWKEMLIDMSNNYLYIIIGSILLICGVLYLFSTLKNNKKFKTKPIEYSKCPNCKTAYDYQKLNKGMCPKCHIPTIEMDEYFKQFPEELKEGSEKE